MVCTIEEFLLLLRNWLTSSARLSIQLMTGPEVTFSGSIGIQTSGHIRSIDDDGKAFVFTNGSDTLLAVELEGWTFGFGDYGALPDQSKRPFLVPGEYDEFLCLIHPHGMRLIIFTTKE